MNKSLQLILLFFIAMLFLGCVEKIKLSDLPIKERLVVNSTNLVNRPWSFEITKSNSWDAPYEVVENAEIKLYGSSGLLEIIEFRPNLNRYESLLLSPESFLSYQIRIETPDLGTVTASTYTPSQVLSVATAGIEITNNNTTFLEVDLTIADLDIEKNYYIVNGYSTIQKVDGSGFTKQTGRVRVNDSNAENQYITTTQLTNFRYLYVNDATASAPQFDNNFKLKFFLDINTTSSLAGTANYEAENKVYIIVYSVSESIYNYLFSSDRFLTSSGSSTANIEGSGVVIQTNIEDGLGVFGAFTTDTIQIR